MAPGGRYLLRFPGQEPNAMFVISFKVFAWQVAQKMTVVCRKADAEGNMAFIWAALEWSPVQEGTGKKPSLFLIFLLGFPSREESNYYGQQSHNKQLFLFATHPFCPVLQKRSRRGKEVALGCPCCSASGRKPVEEGEHVFPSSMDSGKTWDLQE